MKNIASLNLGFLQKLAIYQVLFGISEATRVDVYLNNSSIEEVKSFFHKSGLFFRELRKSRSKNHVAGFVISFSPNAIESFVEALVRKDHQKLLRLIGPQFTTDLGFEFLKKVRDMHRNAPALFAEIQLVSIAA